MTSVLNANAHPFTPHGGMFSEAPPLAIYNDGVPCMMVKKGSESELLHGIADEALEEVFPPDATEAAELEACEQFVMLMMDFVLMEEREEAMRENHQGMAKRWQARRELVGRPKPASHTHNVHPIIHGKHIDTEALVVYDHSHFAIEHKMRAKEHQMNGHVPSNKKKMHQGSSLPIKNRRPIQQPRKFN